MAGRFDSKKGEDGPQRKRDAEPEQEESKEVEAREPEHARLQSQVGNQGVLSMLAGAQGTDGGGGVELTAARRVAHGKSGPELGGDDDPVDAPITIEDLVAGWNPTASKSAERARWIDPMPDDELPPEDEAFLVRVTQVPDPTALPASITADPLVQPSADVVHLALTDWARGVRSWARATYTDQVLIRLTAPPVPALQDPHGRILLGRSRAGAIASLVLLSGPALSGATDVSAAATIDSCLELHARRHRVLAVRAKAQEGPQSQLPVATSLFLDHVASTTGEVEPAEPGDAATFALRAAIAHLADLDDAMALVPDLTEPDADEDIDDPLGLDDLIVEHTGGRAEPHAGLYEAAIQAAERLAAEAARSRVQLAGAAVAVAEVAEDWSVGAPVANLYETLGTLDREIGASLQLLVEIARAAQRRSVPPNGLRNGLRRAARTLDAARTSAIDALVAIVAGVIPGSAAALPTSEPPPEGLVLPFATGAPAEALTWLHTQPASPDRDAAIVLTGAACGASADALVAGLGAARQACGHPLQAAAMGVLLGAAHLAAGRYRDALAVADAQLELGRTRRNGLVVADAALLAMEAHLGLGDEAALDETRLRAGNLLWRMGARGGLGLLARWTRPSPEGADDQPGTYPHTAQPGPL